MNIKKIEYLIYLLILFIIINIIIMSSCDSVSDDTSYDTSYDTDDEFFEDTGFNNTNNEDNDIEHVENSTNTLPEINSSIDTNKKYYFPTNLIQSLNKDIFNKFTIDYIAHNILTSHEAKCDNCVNNIPVECRYLYRLDKTNLLMELNKLVDDTLDIYIINKNEEINNIYEFDL